MANLMPGEHDWMNRVGIGGVPWVPGQTPQQQPQQTGGFLGRLGGALFPGSGENPQAQQNALLQMGLGMMAASSRPGATFGSALFDAQQNASQSYQGAMQNAFRNQLARNQEDRETRAEDREQQKFERAKSERGAVTIGRIADGMKTATDKPAYWQLVGQMPEVQEALKQQGITPPTELDPASWSQFEQQLDIVGNAGAPVLPGSATKGTADIQNWQFYQSLTPEQRQEWMKLQRQPTAPQVVEMNGRKFLVDRIQQTATPLNTLEEEAAAQAAISGAKKQGEVQGTTQGEIEKKGIQAGSVEDILSIADPLIDAATGSATGAAADKVLGFFGKSLDGAEAIAQLKILQTSLVLNMPRMEGPQSNFDAQLYVEAAGSIGDPTVPREQKKAAMKTIRELQGKYKQRAGIGPETQIYEKGSSEDQKAKTGGWSIRKKQ